MRALLAAMIVAAATSVAAAEDVLVTAEDGGTFLVSSDGTWQPVIVGTGDDGLTYLLLDDGTWRMPGAAASIDGAFREAVEAAVRQYEPDLDDGERDQVMVCVMAAFEPLSDEDKQALIAVDIDPDREMQERLERSYPGLEEDLEGCF